MSRETTYNFAAGPSALPTEVLETAAAELTDYRGKGLSVMEMSHRSSAYLDIFNEVKADLKKLLNVPDSHEILFLQGGATLQFAMVPMNLMRTNGSADYVITGNFANNAAKEAWKYGQVRIAASTAATNHDRIPAQEELNLNPYARYLYYCANNTIYGTEWHYVPETKGDVPVVADMSSDILTQPLDFTKLAIVFAGAQKNMAPAGLTVAIVRKDLAGYELPITPVMLSYKTMIEKDSMYNTPPCYNIYMLGLVLKWIEKQGGIAAMDAMKREKSGVIYDYLDESKLFKAHAQKESRSFMNVTFRTGDADKDADFCKAAAAAGFLNVKGHRLVGGMRASVYNAVPMKAATELVKFMKEYEAHS